MTDLTHARLLECLSYDADTGVFRYRISRHYLQEVGAVAGCDDGRGYLQIRIDGAKYWAHRLAWFYVRGDWPHEDIDHVDGDHGNNRITNLRPATDCQNLQNRGKQSNNTSGLKGVTWHKGAQKWLAQIRARGEQHYLGLFEDRDQASATYVAKAKELHGAFTRTA